MVSKQFLSITNRLLLSFTVCEPTGILLPRLFCRFTNLTSLDLTSYNGDLNRLLCQIYFPLKLTSLNLSNQHTIPADGLRAFSKKTTTLTSLTCSIVESINSYDLFLIAECFPLLQELDLSNPLSCDGCYSSFFHGVETLSLSLFKLLKVNLSSHEYINDQSLFHLFRNCKLLEEANVSNCNRITKTGIGKMSVQHSNSLEDFVVRPRLKSLNFCQSLWLRDESIIMFATIFPNLHMLDLRYCYNISKEGIYQVLKRCKKIRDLNLTSSRANLHGMNFEVPKLEVLNLSDTNVDDETLHLTSKNCRGLSRVLLNDCHNITEKGVKHVVENCTQLREISLRGCDNVHTNIVATMVFSRPSLRKIIAPPSHRLSSKVKKHALRQGCVIRKYV